MDANLKAWAPIFNPPLVERKTDACCSGINGSHTAMCPENTGTELVCWKCGETFPAIWAAAWSDNGSAHLDGGCHLKARESLADA